MYTQVQAFNTERNDEHMIVLDITDELDSEDGIALNVNFGVRCLNVLMF